MSVTPKGTVVLACGHSREVFFPASKVEKKATVHCLICDQLITVIEPYREIKHNEDGRVRILKMLGMEPVYDIRCFSHGEPVQTGQLCGPGCDIHHVLIGAKVKNIARPQ